MRKEQAFTLIEVLVAITLLTSLTFLIYDATERSYRINDDLGRESDAVLSVAVSFQTLDRDITQLYSPIFPETKNAGNFNVPDFWSIPQREDGLRRTRFVGSKDKISFISASNRRLYQDMSESDLVKIIWSFEESDGDIALMRSSDFNVFDYADDPNKDNSAKKFKIMGSITSGKFSFYRADKEVWEDSWDSESSYAKNESRFPSIIAIEVEVPDALNSSVVQKWRSEFKPVLDLNFTLPKEDKKQTGQRPR